MNTRSHVEFGFFHVMCTRPGATRPYTPSNWTAIVTSLDHAESFIQLACDSAGLLYGKSLKNTVAGWWKRSEFYLANLDVETTSSNLFNGMCELIRFCLWRVWSKPHHIWGILIALWSPTDILDESRRFVGLAFAQIRRRVCIVAFPMRLFTECIVLVPRNGATFGRPPGRLAEYKATVEFVTVSFFAWGIKCLFTESSSLL